MKIWPYLKMMFWTRRCVICNDPISYDIKVPICTDCLEPWDEQLNVKCISCGCKRDSCVCVPRELKSIVPFVCWAVFYTGDLSYESPDKMVKILKEERSRNVIDFCADLMTKSIIAQCKAHGVDYKEFAITYTPRSWVNCNEYGFDQSKELAKCISKNLGIEMVCAFKNIGSKQQKKLNQEKRRENARKSYILHKKFERKHKKYFLVDDVLTSGATMYFCAKLLYESGAETVIPVTYCKDNIEPKKKKRKWLFF